MALTSEVFASAPIDIDGSVILPITGTAKMPPISSTLIYGEKEAILVDTPITFKQNATLADWIESKLQKKQRLTKIFITHGHADHFFGIKQLKERFPGCEAIAAPGTVEHMKQEVEPTSFTQRWVGFFGTRIPTWEDVEIATALTANEFSLEGHALQIIELGHTDTYSSTALYVPSIGLAVCGDAVYGEVHQMMAEANTSEKRQEWIQAIEKIKALNPKIVVPGHRWQHEEDSVDHLDRTIEYIREFDKIAATTKTAKELFDGVFRTYGRRLNPMALEISCHAAHP